MADKDKSSIDSEVDAYFAKNHPEPIENFYSFKGSGPEAIKRAEEERLKNSLETYGLGAAAGAYATHKDAIRNVGRKFLSPGSPDIYGPRQAPGTMPPMPRVEPSFSIAPQSNLDSETQKIMQSIKDETGSTGRQRERGHNWETNREGMATRQNLTAPGAPKVVVDAGPMTPTRGGIAIPQGVAQSIEDERLMQEARRKAAEETLKREAELLHQAEEAKRIHAAEQAARSATRSGVAAGIGKVGFGALGGALSAKELYDLYKDPRKMKDWTDEDYVRLIGGLGGLASTIPTPMTQAIGLGTAGLSMAYPYAKEYFGGNQAPKR